MSVTIEDCVAKLRALKGKKVQSAHNQPSTPPIKFVLDRLVTIGAIDAEFVPATKANNIQERDTILYWDNALCLRQPELKELIIGTRHLEAHKTITHRLLEVRKVPSKLKDFVCL